MPVQPPACVLDIEGRRIAVSENAARWWADRVRGDPERPLADIYADIERLGAIATYQVEQPGWLHGPGEDGDGWVLFGEDIAMPVTDDGASTTLVSDAIQPDARHWRNKQRSLRRAAKRQSAKSTNVKPGHGYGDKWRHSRK